tara:strand:+ start:3922 stop:7509 length:3588 start_codon:yes stop_codon:yes gene_type:complete
MQIFGINELGETCSIYIKDYNPFIYIKIGESWGQPEISKFKGNLCDALGNFKHGILSIELEEHKTLYQFDNGKKHQFLKITCKHNVTIQKIKKLYYDSMSQELIDGLDLEGELTYLYESQVPPMLRYFHLQKISPSGWIYVKQPIVVKKKTTSCKYEYIVKNTNVIAMPDKEIGVPYKICSFDIEASSSHGDFPLPQKNYSNLAYEIVNHFINKKINHSDSGQTFKTLMQCAFGFSNELNIQNLYLKEPFSLTRFEAQYEKLLMVSEETLKMKKISKQTIDKMLNVNDDEKYKGRYVSYKKGAILKMLCDNEYDRLNKIVTLTDELNKYFPEIKGDEVTYIGSTFRYANEEKPYLNHCIVLDSKDIGIMELDDDASELEVYEKENEVLCAWSKLIQKEDPDIIIGYNILGFDYSFMFKRALETGCVDEFLKLSRITDEVCGERTNNGELKLNDMKIKLASGDYDLNYIQMTGRIQIDLLIYMRKDSGFSFTSFKLDSVAGELISDKVVKVEDCKLGTKIYTKNQKGLDLNSYVTFELISHTSDPYNNGEKFKIIELKKDYFTIHKKVSFGNSKVKWGLAKDDVSPQDIFRMTNEGPEERSIIAKYCIQDCNLVHQLLQKVDILTSFIEMANLCSVPMSFLMFRGQGIKLTSYVAKKCMEKDTLMPLISKGDSEDVYEGAIVLEPKCNLYLDDPVACVDYSSLYPSSIISENISHDSKVWTKIYDLEDNLIEETGEKNKHGEYIYDNLPDFKYVNITYDTFEKRPGPTQASADIKVLTGYKICRFAQFPEGKAILPSMLEELLAARSNTKKQMKKEKDPFMKNVLDKRQLSIKITANSVYGQTGAKTSTFYEIDVAASTTATGRKLLTYAQRIIEAVYKNKICDTSNHGQVKTNAEYVYGDTDSVFFKFNIEDLNGLPIKGKKALEITIELAKEAGALATSFLKYPHDLEYEKTFLPFALLSKKRYVGMLYEEDIEYCSRKSMGLVLKRRDNAPIVKDIYGGIIDILLNDKSIEKAKTFLQESLQDIIDEKISIDKLIITKSLRGFYKNPSQIAHKVLADRMGERDPGNKPSSGDRIPYVYIVNKQAKLQGEKIETPVYIKEHKLKIDYAFYISNQIMKPVLQLFALVLYDMPEFKRKVDGFEDKLETLKQSLDPEKYTKKVEELKTKEVKKILFDSYLIQSQNTNNGNRTITSFF